MGKYDEIVKMILQKREDYFKKYAELPKYIKMPRSIAEELKEIMQEFVTFSVDFQEELKLYDMELCDTLSIDQIEEIEVF